MSRGPIPPVLDWEGFAGLLADFRGDPATSGILTDFDGTVSEIVPRYAGARIIPEAREVLAQLASSYKVYIISGRLAADVASLVDIPGIVYIGGHGLEWLDREAAVPEPAPGVSPYREAMLDAAARLRADARPASYGLVLEDKLWIQSIHWRPAVEAGGDQDRLAEIAKHLAHDVAESLGLRVREGRMVAEIMPPLEVNKGTGAQHFIRQDLLQRALYVGDDRTDIDVFAKLMELEDEGDFRSLRVAVDSAEAPAELMERAQVILPEPSWVAPFLRPLLLD